MTDEEWEDYCDNLEREIEDYIEWEHPEYYNKVTVGEIRKLALDYIFDDDINEDRAIVKAFDECAAEYRERQREVEAILREQKEIDSWLNRGGWYHNGYPCI